jgi:hypothetical protein
MGVCKSLHLLERGIHIPAESGRWAASTTRNLVSAQRGSDAARILTGCPIRYLASPLMGISLTPSLRAVTRNQDE